MLSRLRGLTLPLFLAAAVLLVYLVNPWFTPGQDVRGVVTVLFWVSAVLLILALFEARQYPENQEVEIEGPGFTRFLFNNTGSAPIWLLIRVFLGIQWLDAGLHKFNDPAWTQGGAALRGYWERAVAIPEQGRPPISFEWYRDFLNWLLANNTESWFAWLIALGEIAVGVGLIFGILTGFAAFFGLMMNMSFMLAGSASTNPLMFALAVGVMLAWRVAGYWGVDNLLLSWLGTPWEHYRRTSRTNRPV